MKDLVRLLALALVTLVVAGGAFFYARGVDVSSVVAGWFARSTDELTDTQIGIDVAGSRWDAWLGLAGFPDQHRIYIPIPTGVPLQHGILQLAFESQLAPGGDGRITILINGERRQELVLDPGVNTHELDLPVDPSDLHRRSLIVEFAGIGTTNHGQVCPSDASHSGVAIRVLPASRLVLETGETVEPSVGVRLATLSEPMTLAPGIAGPAQSPNLWALQWLTRQALDVRVAEDSAAADLVFVTTAATSVALDGTRLQLAGEAGLEELAAHRAVDGVPIARPDSWPVEAQDLGVVTSAVNFRGSRRWTLPYALADLPQGLTPTQLDLHLKVSLLAPGSEWVVRVSLNGNLLTSRRFSGLQEDIWMPVTLPVGQQNLQNEILVELIDTSPNQSICRVGPDARAQLLPQTALSAGVAQPPAGWHALVRKLASVDAIALEVPEPLNARQFMEAGALLGSFLPWRTEPLFPTNVHFPAARPNAQAILQITTAGALRTFLATPTDELPALDDPDWRSYLIYRSPRVTQADPELLRMHSLQITTALPALADDEVVFLLTHRQ